MLALGCYCKCNFIAPRCSALHQACICKFTSHSHLIEAMLAQLPQLSFWACVAALATVQPCLDGFGRLCTGTMEASLEQHMGMLAVEHDPWANQWFLHHLVTRERAPLGKPVAGTWGLHFFEDGMGFLDPGGEEAGVDVEEILKVALYVTKSGRHVFDLPEGRVFPDEHVFQHMLMQAMVPVGAARHEAKMDIAVFEWHICICRVRWDALLLYDILGLQTHSGQRSRWVAKSMAQWERFYKAWDVPATLLRSKPYVHKQLDEEAGGTEGTDLRVLSFPSLDSVGLISHLAVWSSCPRIRGGMDLEKDQRACTDLLEGLLLGVHGQLLSLDVWLDPSINFRWPALPVGAHPVSIPVSPSGFVDLAMLKATLQQKPRNISRRLLALDLKHAEEACGNNNRDPLTTMLGMVCC